MPIKALVITLYYQPNITFIKYMANSVVAGSVI